MEFELFTHLILPLLIFLARLVDVSLGTLRILFLSRHQRLLAPMVGFVESLIWLIAISQIVQNLSNWVSYVAFAAGFAGGNYLGMLIEARLAIGLLAVRVITQNDATDLVNYLRENKFGVTSVTATGISGQVKLLFSIIKRSNLDQFRQIVKQFNPEAFMSMEDVRSVEKGFVKGSERPVIQRLSSRK